LSEKVIPKQTDGVRALLGDPKKALWKLAIPIIASNLINSVYNLVDTFWVSGLGADALASVGFFFPFFFMILSLGMGIGIGGGSAASRRIGADDHHGASEVATHTILIMFLIALSFTIPLVVFSRNLFSFMGARNILDLTNSYGVVMFGGTIFILFAQIASSLLRSEGDTKRAMYAMAFGSVMNIILDPIFIYTFHFGVSGAAWASVISMGISSLIMAYWLFFKKDTYISFHFRKFRFKGYILRDIFKVGIPASIQMMTMALSMFILNFIVVKVGGSDGVAVFSTGWRIFTFGSMPIFGISTAVVSISAAAYGAKDISKLSRVFTLAIKYALLIEIPIFILLQFFTPNVAWVFTRSQEAIRIYANLVTFLRIVSLSFLAIAFGPISSSMFQGIGKGEYALATTVLRTLILTPIFALFFTFYLRLGLIGIWSGIVMANLTGSLIAFAWGKLHIKELEYNDNIPDRRFSKGSLRK